MSQSKLFLTLSPTLSNETSFRCIWLQPCLADNSCFEYLFWDTAQLTIFLIVVIWITANCKEIFSIFSPLISFMEFCLFEEHARNAIAINIMGCYFSYHHGQENQHYALSCVLCDTRLYSEQVRRRKSWDENYFCLN